MRDINIIIHHGGGQQSVSTQDDIILGDLLQQLADHGLLPQGNNWLVTKANRTAAMDLGRTLAENGIVDGDVLDVGLPSVGG